jgi:UDP-N-acetylmuramyl pentapeptide phosphotransferase/UDP-N-acetylglucosamine-1-phosphate transferase
VTRGAAAVLGGTVTLAARTALARHPPGGRARWERRNHAGRPVSLLGGPVAVAGLLAAAGCAEQPMRVPGLLAVAGAGAAGLYDDLFGATHARGLRGHLRALRAREVTTGIGKLVAIGTTAAGVGGLLLRADTDLGGSDTVVAAALVAGSANLANLFDLRPGRTLKLAIVASGMATASGRRGAVAAAGVAGVAAAALPADLAEQTMLGDAGANALGAALGLVAAAAGRRARCWSLAAVLALTAASELVSFSAVIEATPLLRRLDALGRT